MLTVPTLDALKRTISRSGLSRENRVALLAILNEAKRYREALEKIVKDKGYASYQTASEAIEEKSELLSAAEAIATGNYGAFDLPPREQRLWRAAEALARAYLAEHPVKET